MSRHYECGDDGRFVAEGQEKRGRGGGRKGSDFWPVNGQEVEAVDDLRHAFIGGLAPDGPALPRELGHLQALAGVKRFPPAG